MGRLANRSLFFGIAVVIGSALAIPPDAHAGTIIDLGAAGCGGAVCGPLAYTGGSLTLEAEGGTFTTKTRHGATGLGISGATRGEIDVNEFVRGTFSSPVFLEELTVLFLYNGGEFGDPTEIAQVSINGGSVVGTLISTDENAALWDLGAAEVTSCGDTSVTGTGCFKLANPFLGRPISDIAFTAVSAGVGLPNNSDFSLGTIEVSALGLPAVEAPAFEEQAVRIAAAPEPGALIMLALGSVALVARRKCSTH